MVFYILLKKRWSIFLSFWSKAFNSTGSQTSEINKAFKPGRGGNDTQRSPAGTENYCESKKTYFSYSLDKAFHFLEFQAK